MRTNHTKEIGHILSFFSGIAKIQGLPHVFVHEVLLDENQHPIAIVIGFNEHLVEALFFDEVSDLDAPIFRSMRAFSIPFSSAYLGRIVDGFGRPLDSLGDIAGDSEVVFRQAPAIIDRQQVTQPLSTGIKIIDTNLPLGRGQRELIIGDRRLGKSTIALDMVLNQRDAEQKVHCIYVLIGQKKQVLQEVLSVLKEENALAYSTVVAATAEASFAEQYLAPFVGSTIAEYTRDHGKDALIIYDDLSKHAKVYRSISLLLERAPGREAYPGDIFFLHGQLLERAAKLSKEQGGGSLTAIPIVETQEGDITSFIPTNIISITDGQIYLERGLFQKGFLPAVNVGLSISRIGSEAQPKILTQVVGGIRLVLSQHKELQKLSQLETSVSTDAQQKIDRGDLIVEILKQDKHVNITWPEQVILFYSVEQGLFDHVAQETWPHFEKLLLELVRSRYQRILQQINTGTFDDTVKKNITDIVSKFQKEFSIPS